MYFTGVTGQNCYPESIDRQRADSYMLPDKFSKPSRYAESPPETHLRSLEHVAQAECENESVRILAMPCWETFETLSAGTSGSEDLRSLFRDAILNALHCMLQAAERSGSRAQTRVQLVGSLKVFAWRATRAVRCEQTAPSGTKLQGQKRRLQYCTS